MSYFGTEKIVTTRKEHYCVSCNRKIPKGKKTYHVNGMWEGDWQNWYMCLFCDENELCDPNEAITGCEFDEWVHSLNCPNCNTCNNSWEWTDNDESIEISCGQCNHEWTLFIGWGKQGVEE